MAPSLSPSFIPTLDARGQPAFSAGTYADRHYDHLLARQQVEVAAPPHSGAQHGIATPVIVLSVILGVIGFGALVALWFVVAQRRQLHGMRTIRVLYNVDSLPADAQTTNVSGDEKATVFGEKPQVDGTMFTIDLSPESDDEKPHRLTRTVSNDSSSSSGDEASDVLSPLGGGLKRRISRAHARQRLRIIIPKGVAVAGVELVYTAAMGTPAAAGGTTALATGVSLSGRTATLSRRGTAKSAKSPLVSALSSAVTMVSEAAIRVVQRRENVEAVYQSNGWAPAQIVYLPKNPRDHGIACSPGAVMRRKTTTRKSVRRPLRTPLTADSRGAAMVQQDVKRPVEWS